MAQEADRRLTRPPPGSSVKTHTALCSVSALGVSFSACHGQVTLRVTAVSLSSLPARLTPRGPKVWEEQCRLASRTLTLQTHTRVPCCPHSALHTHQHMPTWPGGTLCVHTGSHALPQACIAHTQHTLAGISMQPPFPLDAQRWAGVGAVCAFGSGCPGQPPPPSGCCLVWTSPCSQNLILALPAPGAAAVLSLCAWLHLGDGQSVPLTLSGPLSAMPTTGWETHCPGPEAP